MSDRLPSARRSNWNRARALLSVGILLGIGSVGTLAAFSTTATVKPGSFTTGTLDIGFGTPATYYPLSDLSPGESVANSFPVTNLGNIPLTYTAQGSVSGALAQALQFTIYPGGTTTDSSHCSGTASVSAVTLNSTPKPVIGTPQQVAANQSQNVCVLVSLPATTDRGYQGTAATATITLNALQAP